MLDPSELKAMFERQALLYIGYIVEGVEGDYLRQLIHTQICHVFEKVGREDEVDELLHNLDRIGFTNDAIVECKYRTALQNFYARQLAKRLLELYGEHQ